MKISPLILKRIVFIAALNILTFIESGISGVQGESRKLNMHNLNLNADVRALGMADAAVAQKEGVPGINFNPASIGFLRNAEVALMYNGFENIINYGFLGYAVAVDSTWSLGFSA